MHEYRLPNGLQVLLIPDASKPTVTVNVTYRVGSRMEGYGETGMAHLLEHLMFKSTKHIRRSAPSCPSAACSSTARRARTAPTTSRPSRPTRRSSPGRCKTEAERMTHANVIKKDLDSEMTVVRNEMESGENNPFRILIEKTNAAAFQWHAYGKDTIGARSDVENVNIPHLQAFYRKYYQPDNATLIVAGKFDADKTLAEIAQDFGAIPKPTRVIEPTYTVEPVQDGERQVTLRRPGGEQDLYATYHTPSIASPDMPAFSVIGRSRSATRPTADCTSGWSKPARPRRSSPGPRATPTRAPSTSARAEEGRRPRCRAEDLPRHHRGLKAEPITADELKRAQLQVDKSFDQMLADPQNLCLTLSEYIAGGDWRLLFLQRDRVDALTLDQVNAVAATWLKSSNRTLGRFVPTDAPDRAPLATRTDPEEQLKDFKPRATVAAGETFDSTPAGLDKRSQVLTLPNGMKLALLPKKSKGGTVEMRFDLHFGSLESLRGKRAAGAGGRHHPGHGHRDEDARPAARRLRRAQDRLGADRRRERRPRVADHAARRADARARAAGRGDAQAVVHARPSTSRACARRCRASSRPPRIRAASRPAAGARAAALRLRRPALHAHVRRVDRRDPGDQAGRRGRVLPQRYWGADHGDMAIVGDFDAEQVQAAVTRLFGDWKSPRAVRAPAHPGRPTWPACAWSRR